MDPQIGEHISKKTPLPRFGEAARRILPLVFCSMFVFIAAADEGRACHKNSDGGGGGNSSDGGGASNSGGKSGGGASGSSSNSGGGTGNSSNASGTGKSSGASSNNSSGGASAGSSGGWVSRNGKLWSSSGGAGVGYDANRSMVTFDLKIGEKDHRQSLELEHRGYEEWAHRGHDHGDADSGHFNDVELRKLEKHLHEAIDDWKESHALENLNQTVNAIAANSASTPQESAVSERPVAIQPAHLSDAASDSIAAIYDHAAAPQQNESAAEAPGRSAGRSTSPVQQNNGKIGADARVEIGSSTFMPNEVLALDLDQTSMERAGKMGFKASSQSLASKASNHVIMRFTVPSGLDAVQGQQLLSRELPGYRFELNKVYRLYRAAERGAPDNGKPAVTPGEPSRCEGDHCFAWAEIHWKEALAPCARDLKVGVIDTDIDQSHPVFAGRKIHRFDFSADGHGVSPNEHGTAVLSLLAGGLSGGVPGLIPDAEFFAANIFFYDERGEMAADTLSLLKALDWMNNFGVKLVNMSFSGPSDELVAEAIGKLSKKGLVFVAAAGNEGPAAPPAYPAAYPQVIAVTAVTKDLRNYRYANRGDHIDVAAPGVGIWTAMPGGRAGYQSGTSFAAPYVTAILAVEPREMLRQEKAALLESLPVIDLGRQRRDPVYGRGLLVAPSQCAPSWETVAQVE